MKYNDLVACCHRLSAAAIPASSAVEHQGQKVVDGHWTGTMLDMRSALGRDLTDCEITVLSLGRCYGPTPLLSPAEKESLIKSIWPDSNGWGGWMEWQELADEIFDHCVA
jgi:hypothetical protein